MVIELCAYFVVSSLKVPDTSFSIPVSATRQDLNSLIAHLIQGMNHTLLLRAYSASVGVCVRVCMYVLYCNSASENGGDAEGVDIEVEFLIRGDLLRSTIESHLAKKTVSSVSQHFQWCFSCIYNTHSLHIQHTILPLCIQSVCISAHTIYVHYVSHGLGLLAGNSD